MGMSERSTIELILQRMEDDPHPSDKERLIKAIRSTLNSSYHRHSQDSFAEGYHAAVEDMVGKCYYELRPFL